MATAVSSPPAAKSGGLMRKVTSKLKRVVDGEDQDAASIRPARAGTLRSKAREQMRTGKGADDFQFGDTDPTGQRELVIDDNGWGSDGKLYIKNLDETAPATSSSHGAGPSSSSIRPIGQQPTSSAPSPHSLPYNSPPSSHTSPSNITSPPRRPSDAYRSTSRRPSEPSDAFAQPRAAPSPSQGRARSQSQSQPSSTAPRARFDASDAPPLPGRGGVTLAESYASPIPRSKSGPDQRASTSGEFSRTTVAGGEGETGGWSRMKRAVTLTRKGGRAEARAQEAAAARDPNRSPSPPRVAAAPKMYTAAQLAVKMDEAARAAAAQEAAAYRASVMTMGPRIKAAEAKEESRLTEAAFY